jgi:Na+-driven multidrug efflux pump
MRPGLKAFLLSAFIFPGMGQLYNQDRRKGVALVLGTNLLLGVVLLVSLVLFSQEYLSVFYPRPLTWELVKVLLLALWGFAMVDAAQGAGRSKPAAKP